MSVFDLGRLFIYLFGLSSRRLRVWYVRRTQLPLWGIPSYIEDVHFTLPKESLETFTEAEFSQLFDAVLDFERKHLDKRV